MVCRDGCTRRHFLKAVGLVGVAVLIPAHAAWAGQAGKSPVKVFVLAGQSKGGYVTWGTALFSPGEWAGAVVISAIPLTEASVYGITLYLPNVTSLAMFGDDGYTAAKYPYLQRTYTYGVQVSVPIWEGSRRESRVEERDAVLRGADLRKRDLETQIAVDVRAALLDLSAAREQVAAASDAVSFAEQAVAQARDRFRTGVAGSGDVVSAQLDASASRSQLVDALTALQSARVALARAQGRLSAMP